MAELENDERTPRLFAPKAPFELGAFGLAALALLLYGVGVAVIARLCSTPALTRGFVLNLYALLGPTSNPPSLGAVRPGLCAFLLVSALIVVLWTFLGGAITRIFAMRIARDESIKVKEALAFAWKNKGAYMLPPIIIALAVTFFALCNMLAGTAADLFGILNVQILLIVLYPLAALSALFGVFIGLLGLVGGVLLSTSVSADGGDAFDALTRAYSYILSKPVQFVTYSVIIALMAVVICGVGHSVIAFSFDGIRYMVGEEEFEPYRRVLGLNCRYVQRLDNLIRGSEPSPAVPVEPPTTWLQRIEEVKASFPTKATISVLSVMVGLMRLMSGAAVLSYVISAYSSVYFMLRYEVDGTPLNEVYAEDEEEEEVALPGEEPAEAPPAPAEPQSAGKPAEEEEKAEEPAEESKADDKPAPAKKKPRKKKSD
jgi:hypothetical protein